MRWIHLGYVVSEFSRSNKIRVRQWREQRKTVDPELPLVLRCLDKIEGVNESRYSDYRCTIASFGYNLDHEVPLWIDTRLS